MRKGQKIVFVLGLVGRVSVCIHYCSEIYFSPRYNGRADLLTSSASTIEILSTLTYTEFVCVALPAKLLRILICRIRCNFWQFKNILYMGFRATLYFRKFEVALNPMYKILLNFAKSCIFSFSSNFYNKKKFHRAVFKIEALKAGINGVFSRS